MNVFLISDNPVTCAHALDDRRLNRAVRDVALIMSTVVGGKRRTMQGHHPWVKWTGASLGNFDWMMAHGVYCSEEFASRFAKLHAFHDVFQECFDGRTSIPKGSLLSFVNATHHQDMKIEFAYRHDLNNKWDEDKRTPRWTMRRPPAWTRRQYDRVGPAYVYRKQGIPNAV